MRLKLVYVVLVFSNFICWARSSDQRLLQKAKTALLTMLELEERPKTEEETVVNIPKTMRDLYNKQINFKLDTASIPVKGLYTESANTVRSFLHAESHLDKRFHRHHQFRLMFNVTLPDKESLKAAELKLFADVAKAKLAKEDRFQRILVYDIIRPGSKKRELEPLMRLIDSKVVDLEKNNKFISLDVVAAVRRWVESPKGNHGLFVKIAPINKKGKSDRYIRLKRDVDEDVSSWEILQPILLAYSDDGKNKQKTGTDMRTIRTKRASRRNHRKGERDSCRRQQMYVNFSDVGWSDWIVAPLGYEAFFCDGECAFPLAEHMNTTNHAIVQSLMNSVRPNDVPKACCVPTQLSSMSMLYVDTQGNVILKNYKEMVVIGCGCR